MAGFSTLKRLLYLTLPGLILLHLIAVTISPVRVGEGAWAFFARLLHRDQGTCAKTASSSVRFGCVLAFFGALLMIVNYISPAFYQHGCYDPLVRGTVAFINSSDTYRVSTLPASQQA